MILQNINEVVAQIRAEAVVEARETAVRILERAEESVKLAESNRLAVILLDGLGLEVGHGKMYARIDLGYFKATKKGNAELAAIVKRVRQALGCRLEQAGKDVHDVRRRLVQVELRPVDFPTVRITFVRKLPADAGCKIVRHRSNYASLVCEA